LAKGCENEGEQKAFHGAESCRLAKRLAMLGEVFTVQFQVFN
jgi:hypothetical protein